MIARRLTRSRGIHIIPALLASAAGSAAALGGSFPPFLNRSSLNGDNGFVVDGIDMDNRSGFSVPSDGVVRIAPRFGGVVTTPAAFIDLRSLTIGSELGITTLDLIPGSVLIVEEAIDLSEHAAVAGFGTLATLSTISSRGMIVMDDLSILADDGVHNEPDGDIAVNLGFIAGELRNHGLIDITPDTPGDPAALDVLGPIANNPDGIIALRNGLIDLAASEPLVNRGQIIFINTEAAVFAETQNPGVIELLNNSTAIFFEGLTSTGAITVEPGSTLAVLGAFSGRGVAGPAGPGSAGAAYLGGAFDPRAQDAIGAASFDGDLTLGAASITTIEIGGTAPGTGHDQITVSGVFDPAGVVRIVTTDGYLPPTGAAYNLLDFGSVLGAFTTIELDAALSTRCADTSTLLIDGILRIPAPSCPGDITGDGSVSTADFNVLAGNFGQSVPPNTGGDLTGDGFVNTADFNILAGDFGCSG